VPNDQHSVRGEIHERVRVVSLFEWDVRHAHGTPVAIAMGARGVARHGRRSRGNLEPSQQLGVVA
jgi:hypothetical protein